MKFKNNVLDTTYEAASSKLSAVDLGYYYDPYLKYFVKKKQRRTPIINRGYYSRVAGLRLYIEQFLKSMNNEEIVQIVNIGAGLDTTFFWINEQYKNIRYFEIDFYELLYEKTKIIKNISTLEKFLIYNENYKKDEDIINCVNYKMIHTDLNEWKSVENSLKNNMFDFNKPTLFICECVLIYLETENSDMLIKQLSHLMKNTSCIIVYEQYNPNNAFGKIMIDNFNSRGIALKSIYKYSNLDLQKNRYKLLGWRNVYVNCMNEVYDNHLDTKEKKVIEKLEMFDEFEEWRLLQNHYFILIAFNCYNNLNLDYLEFFLKEKMNK